MIGVRRYYKCLAALVLPLMVIEARHVLKQLLYI
jgi:hypothetical protein